MSRKIVVLCGVLLQLFGQVLTTNAQTIERAALAGLSVNSTGALVAHLHRELAPSSPWGTALSDAATPPLAQHFAGNFLGAQVDSIASVFVDGNQTLRARITSRLPTQPAVLWPQPLNSTGIPAPLAIVAGDFSPTPDGITDLAVVYAEPGAGNPVRVKVTFGPTGATSATWSDSSLGSGGIVGAESGRFQAGAGDQIAIRRLAPGATAQNPSQIVQLVGAPNGQAIVATSNLGTSLVHRTLAGDFDGDGIDEFALITFNYAQSRYVVERRSALGAVLSSNRTVAVPGIAKFLVGDFDASTSGEELVAIRTLSSGLPQAEIYHIGSGSGSGAAPKLGEFAVGSTALAWFLSGKFDTSSYKISGKVTLPGGVTPVAGVTITNTRTGLTAQTNAQGVYEFAGLGAGTYTLRAALGGYSFEPQELSVEVSSADRTEQNFIAVTTNPQQRYTVSGRIMRSSGVPALGISVELRRLSAEVVATLQTNSAGNYQFTGVPTGAYEVRPVAPALHELDPQSITVSPLNSNRTLADFILRPIGSTTTPKHISGTVTLPGGVGLSGVVVQVFNGSELVGQQTTSDSGAYQTGPFADGSYRVAPSRSGFSFAPVEQNVSVNGASVNGVNFEAVSSSTYRIFGRVVRPGNAEGIAGVSIRTEPATAQAISGADGSFTLTGIHQGTYRVIAEGAGLTLDPSAQDVTVVSSDVTGVTFYVLSSSRYRIRGQISRIDGSPVSGAQVSFQQGTTPRAVSTDALGFYEAADVPLGTYVLTPSLGSATFSPTSRQVPVVSADVEGQNFQALCPAGQYLVGETCAVAAALEARLECVMNNGDGTYTAYFGYQNNNAEAVTVPAGITVPGFRNETTPSADAALPAVFEPGREFGAVRVPFTAGTEASWTLQYAGLSASAAVATVNSAPCAPVLPRAECRSVTIDREMLVHFGYQNDNPFEVRHPLGSQNRFSPAPESRGQPSTLREGHNMNVLALPFSENLTWTLGTQSVSTTSLNTELCEPEQNNQAPTSVVGGPYTTACQGLLTTLALNGSGSHDPEGTRLEYRWTTNCPQATFSSTAVARPELVLQTPGQGVAANCSVTLEVFDGLATHSSTSSVSVPACNLDCQGTPNGSAQLDQCGVCNGANLCLDCAGVPFGAARIDQCGVCGGTNACLDCAGVPNGLAALDRCGVCNGSGLTCLGCTDVESRPFSLAIDSASLKLRDAVKRSIRRLTKQVSLRFSGKRAAAVRRSLSKRRAEAVRLDEEIRSALFSIPERIFTCAAQDACTQDDYLGLVKTVRENIERLAGLGLISVRDLKKLRIEELRGVVKKDRKRINDLKAEALKAGNAVPRFVSRCE